MNCPICGTKLLETTHENFYCPNHGMVYTKIEDLEDKEGKIDYIG